MDEKLCIIYVVYRLMRLFPTVQKDWLLKSGLAIINQLTNYEN